MRLGAKINQNSGVYNKYPSTFTFEGKKVLNLGCGFAKYKANNVVNLDAFDNCQPDVKWDLTKTPLPFEDETFDFIIANHSLEHVSGWWEVFRDCARILKVGGHMEIWGPGMGGDAILGFRDHVNTINQCSFFGILGHSRPNNAWAMNAMDDSVRQMKMIKTDLNLINTWWVKKAPRWLQMWMANHLRNIIFEVGFFFEKQAAEQLKPDLDYRIVEAML